MADDDVITNPRNGLCPEMLVRVAMFQPKSPMEFHSDMQKVNECMRLETENTEVLVDPKATEIKVNSLRSATRREGGSNSDHRIPEIGSGLIKVSIR